MSPDPTEPLPPPERQFKGIWICAAIWEDDDLTLAERCLIAEVDSLCGRGKACYASNAFLAKRLRLSDLHMNGMLSDLTRWGYLIRLAFTGRQTLRCVHPMFSSNAETVHELLRQHGVTPPVGRPRKDPKGLEKSSQSSLGIKPKASRVGIKPKAGLTCGSRQPGDTTQPQINAENTMRTTTTAAAVESPVVVASLVGQEETKDAQSEKQIKSLAVEFGTDSRQRAKIEACAKRRGLAFVLEQAAIVRSNPKIEN
jgi:hypothetical protein